MFLTFEYTLTYPFPCDTLLKKTESQVSSKKIILQDTTQ